MGIYVCRRALKSAIRLILVRFQKKKYFPKADNKAYLAAIRILAPIGAVMAHLAPGIFEKSEKIDISTYLHLCLCYSRDTVGNPYSGRSGFKMQENEPNIEFVAAVDQKILIFP